jgi:hypothetical protein
VRLRAILGLVIFPILGNLLRLGSERLVAYMDVRRTVLHACLVCRGLNVFGGGLV